MKQKLYMLAMILFVLIAAVIATPVEQEETGLGRVHQHMTWRKDTGCECDGSQLCSHLPLVIIDTGGNKIPGDEIIAFDEYKEPVYAKAEDGTDFIETQVSIIDNRTANNHPGDAPKVETASLCRYRGHSSRHFDKRQYLLKFIKEDETNNRLPVMGMEAHHEWVLHGPYLDKSLIRNYMWYNISGEMMDYAPNVRFCELIVDGSYEGLYLMTESITDGENCRLDLSKNVKGSQAAGYLLRSDRPTEADIAKGRDIYTYTERMLHTYKNIVIKYPGVNELTEEYKRKIEQQFSEFEKCLYSFDYDVEEYGYHNWIDVDNFIDYYIINEFTGNMDSVYYSTYIYKELNEKLRLCVWDFNNSCDFYDDKADPESLIIGEKTWFYMLFKDEKFVERLINRYHDLRKTFLNEEYLHNYIDETVAYLGPAIERNDKRWYVSIHMWEPLLPSKRNVYSHEEAIDQLKKWIDEHGEWLDENIDVFRAIAHPSRNHAYNH